MFVLFVIACTSDPQPRDTALDTVPWTREVSPLDLRLRDRHWQRGIVHLHSPWSHDACDGEGIVDGEPNQQCLADFRAALCDNALDFGFITDHPAHMAFQAYEDLLWIDAEAGDQPWPDTTAPVANQMACPSGHNVLLAPGLEDELMPVLLDRHMAGTDEERDAAYNGSSPETIALYEELGGPTLVAHPEGRSRDAMLAHQDAGLIGTEAFNLHAMVDPNIREDDLGLDGLAWISDVAVFLDPYSTLTSDLIFLGFVEPQLTNLAHWDALSARGPMTGVAGSDAHRNSLPMLMADGERVDSYRRMLRWFSNWLLTDSTAPDDLESALRAGRNLIVFEAFGRPTDPDVHVRAEGGEVAEIGSEVTGGTLVVSCDTLSQDSPRGLQAPEIHTTVFKDGEFWAEGCGEHTLDGPGVYRVGVDITPWHLVDFLDGDSTWIRRVPWLLYNPVRHTGD